MIGIRCAALSQAMINRSKTFATATRNGKGRKRQKPPKTADSNQDDTRNRGLNRRGSNGGLEGDTRADIEPSGYASTVVRQKELQEIVSTLKLVQYGPSNVPPLTIFL